MQKIKKGETNYIIDRLEFVYPSDFHFHASTECGRERDTAEILTVFAAVDRGNVEKDDQQGEHPQAAEQTDEYRNVFNFLIRDVEVDVRHEGERKKKSEDETEQMSVVIDHRQKSDDEEEQEETSELGQLDAW